MMRNIIASLVESVAITMAVIIGITMDLMFFVVPQAVRKMKEKIYDWAGDYKDVYRIDEDNDE